MSEILKVSWNKIRTLNVNWEDYICLTDIAKEKNNQEERFVIQNWMRKKSTIWFLWLWEELNNNNFNRVKFDTVKNEAWENAFTMTPKKWIELINPIWIISKAGRYNSWTYAHKDIAFEFASWISVEFKLYLIKEFQRLKEIEQKRLEPEWNVKRILSKLNYRIHTDSVKQNLIDWKIESKFRQSLKYADEADMLNVAIFWKTNKMWREKTWINNKKKNIRDYASIQELIVLSNLEYLNSVMIEEWITEKQRFKKLCEEAVKQLQNIIKNKSVKKLKTR
jgi:hypothetical protein